MRKHIQKVAVSVPLAPPGGLRGEGPLGLEGVSGSSSVPVFNRVISSSIGIITAIAFIWFTVNLMIGAFNMLTAGSDKNKFAESKKKISNNVIGVVVTVSAIFIASLIGQILGVSILGGADLIYVIAP